MPLADRQPTFMANLRARSWLPFLIALDIRGLACWFSHGMPVVDMHSFWIWARNFEEGFNPYAATNLTANYPPLWVFLCWVCLKISAGAPEIFDYVLKLLISVVDAATVWPIRGATRAVGATDDEANRAAWFYAINPASILIASFHGQNDPVAIGLVMWAAWLVLATPVRFAHELALLLVGVSLTIKPIAVLFLPIMLWQMPTWRRRVIGLAVAALPSAVAWLPFLVAGYADVAKALTSYGNVADFGYIGIFNSWSNLGRGSSGEAIVKSEHVTWQFRAAWFALLAVAWWRKRSAGILEQLVGLVLCLYLVYGLLAAQYLMWLIPFATAQRNSRLWRISGWSALALFAFYELHHPDMIYGGVFKRLPLWINVPQWSGIFLFSQLFLYGNWFRSFWELAVPRDVWSRMWRWFVSELRRIGSGAWNWVRGQLRRLTGGDRE